MTALDIEVQSGIPSDSDLVFYAIDNMIQIKSGKKIPSLVELRSVMQV